MLKEIVLTGLVKDEENIIVHQLYIIPRMACESFAEDIIINIFI